MGEQTTTVVPFAAGGPSALATSRQCATSRKKNRFSAVPNRSSVKAEKRPLDGRYRKSAAEAWPQEVRHACRCSRQCRSNGCIICNSACSGSIRVPVVLLR